MHDKEWFYWGMPQFTVRFVKSDGSILKERFIRCARALEQGKWADQWIDTKIPLEDFAHIEMLLQQPHGTKMLIGDDLYIETYSEKNTN